MPGRPRSVSNPGCRTPDYPYPRICVLTECRVLARAHLYAEEPYIVVVVRVLGPECSNRPNPSEYRDPYARFCIRTSEMGNEREAGDDPARPAREPLSRRRGGYGTEKPFSEEIARIVDSEVLRIMDESHDEARRLLTKPRKELDALASALLERGSLDEKEILEVTGLPPAPLENSKVPVPDANPRA